MKVIGHRGAAGLAPENTFAGFDLALELGVDGIETDVQKTKDGKLVLFHDNLLDRTTNGAGVLQETSWQALQQLDAGSWFDSNYAGERIRGCIECIISSPFVERIEQIEIHPTPARVLQSWMRYSSSRWKEFWLCGVRRTRPGSSEAS